MTTQISSRSIGGATGIFGVITRVSLYALFFLTPLFFLPWTSSILEVNKQLLLVVLTIVALVAWLGQMVITKRLTFRSGWLNLVPGLFLLSVLISSFASLAGYQTWIGQASQEYVSFLSTSMFVILFYLLKNNAGDTQIQKGLISSLLLSGAIGGVLMLLGIFDLFHLPFGFAQSLGFTTVGTVNGMISFLTPMMFVGLAMWLVSARQTNKIIPDGAKGAYIRALIVILSLSNLVAMMVVDFWVFWVINLIGVLLLAGFVFLQQQEFPNLKRFLIPVVIGLISILFLFIRTPIKVDLPLVVSPSYGMSWQITKTTLGVNSGQLLFGSGPGTFLHDYLAYKPAEVNASPFWSVRFDRAKSSALTTLTNLGIVGTGLWFLLMLWIAVKTFGRLLKERDHEEWKMTYILFSGWALLFALHLLYSSNMTMQFLLWSFTGLLASQVMVKIWKTDFRHSPKLGLGVSFAFVIVSVGVLTSLFVTGQRYLAEVSFAKALVADRSGAPVEEVVGYLNTAVKYNGLSDVYYRNLSSALLAQARQKIASESAAGELSAEATQQISALVSSSIEAATKAASIEPNYVANWVMRGSIYRDVMSFAQGAEDLAAAMFSNAVRMEPTSPVHRTNLGRVYATVADRARNLKGAEDAELAKTATEQEVVLLKTAEQAYTSAIQLKPDYAPAHYYLAAVYERQGRLEDATARLVALRNNAPSDIGLAFQLSQMLIRLGNYDVAREELERITTIRPDYSNALWFLASMHEINNNRSKAIELVQKVVDLNPQNEVAKDRLSRLNAGQVTTTIPEPIQAGQGASTSAPEVGVVEPPAVEEGAEDEVAPEQPEE